MNNRFFIQARTKGNPIDRIINSGGDAQDWEPLPWTFDNYESAKRECELRIQNGHRASDIRIVEVVGTFDAEIIVNDKSEKYSN